MSMRLKNECRLFDGDSSHSRRSRLWICMKRQMEKMMKIGILSFLLLGIAGCATTNVSLTGSSKGAGTLEAAWFEPHSIEIQLDGKRYAGQWSSSSCSGDSCQNVSPNNPKAHQRHIRVGKASLLAPDGSGLECEWVSHLPALTGTCRTQDGREYRLKQAD